MSETDGYDHVPFVQGMQLPPHTVAHGAFVVPDGFYDHPIPKWMAENPGAGWPSRRRSRRIMRAARRAGFDFTAYEDAVRKIRATP